MSKGKFDIKSILDIPRWEAVQDQLAKATGTAIITIDYKGTPITKHSMRTDFCSIIRENPISCKRCQKCDSLAGLGSFLSEEELQRIIHIEPLAINTSAQ